MIKNLVRAALVVICSVIFSGQQQYVSIKSFGAIGDGLSHPLSSIYPSLAAAQAVYPFVSDLTQELDWAATQAAIDYAYANGNQNVFCPAVSKPGFVGRYLLSNPIYVDQPVNARARGNRFFWNSTTTFGFKAEVIYNGIPWISLGSGNIGNPPTSAPGYPAQITQPNTFAVSNSFLPFANVQISNASPAVITLTAHGLSAGTPLIFQVPSGGALPTGINVNQVYYVISAGLGTNTFEISATPGGAAVNTSSAGTGVPTISDNVWLVDNNIGPFTFTERDNFIGDDGLSGNQGCIFQSLSYVGPAFLIGTGNGNLDKNFTVVGPTNGADYRCQKPGPTEYPANTGIPMVGIGLMSDTGGSSRTKLENVGSQGFYYGYLTGITGSTLVDSVTVEKAFIQENCVAMRYGETQSFINSIIESSIHNSGTLIDASIQAGVNIWGGNYSTNSNIAAGFAVTGVFSSGNTLTATITTPDTHLLHPLCSLSNKCGYNIFTVNTAHFGLVPMTIASFNPFTKVATFTYDPNWNNPYGGGTVITSAAAFITDIAAITKIYATEFTTTFNGAGIETHGIHIENDGTPFTLIHSITGFGSGRPNYLVNTYFNSNISLGDLNATPSDANLAKFFAQQTEPFIWLENADLIVDGFNGGQDLLSSERLLIQLGTTSNQFEMRHTQGAGLVNTGSSVSFHFRGQAGGVAPAGTFTNGYLRDSASAFGSGLWDNASSFLARGQTNAIATGLDTWRSGQWGQSPMWGVRPAPWSNPCITPAQVTSLGALPAITYVAVLGAVGLNAAGTLYHAGDVLTMVGGTFTTAAQITVDTVGGGGNILTFHISNGGSYTVAPTSFTSSGGFGSGATWNAAPPNGYSVQYTIGYPTLWGGQLYRVCDWTMGAQAKYGLLSTNLGYSYFQNLTGTNVPNMKWTTLGGSPAIYLNSEAMELMFPGLEFTMVGSGSPAGCVVAGETVVVTEVHISQGYVLAVNANDGSPYLPSGFTAGTTCTGTTLTQQATNLVNPF